MGIKPRKKNHYKSGFSSRITRIKLRLLLCLKMLSVITVVSGMSFAFIFGHDLLTQCDYFKVENVYLTGLSKLSSHQLSNHAKIHNGMNIFSINLPVTRKRLLAHPWIDDADVSRKLPNEIHIRVKEHRPLAILNLGRKFIINTRGNIFKEWSVSDPETLPIISGLEFSDLKVPGEQAPPSFSAVMGVLRLGEKNGSVLPNRLIKSIHVDREVGLTLFAFDKFKAIKLGYNDYPNKYKILKNILFHLTEQQGFTDFESIDLNNLNRIVVNPVRFEPTENDHKEV